MNGRIESNIVVERTYKADAAELWELWTTKDGFESWWGPEQFRVEVDKIEARSGGALHYTMIAHSPEAVAAMKRMGAPTSQPCRGLFAAFKPYERLVLTQTVDFLPGVDPYESTISVDFFPLADGKVRMVVTLSRMHDEATTDMQRQGFASQLSKLDRRYAGGPQP